MRCLLAPLFRPLQKVATIFLGIVFGMALVKHLATALLGNVDPSWVLIVLMVSPVAYFIRESRLRSKRREARQNRGTERMPITPVRVREVD